MGKQIDDQEKQITYLKERLNMFLEVLDSMEPESTRVEDIDRLIAMMDELELKMEQFKK
ncbi:SE1561 family protein [Paenisporosarcina cavernae]|uniref:SE1561 family protein n=1 Tax=Paenisporosarcina cavernae TaxID=2320858 RepID=UPI0013C44799|nr:SE1561 family protein [Paenisporosarcina cavernae]